MESFPRLNVFPVRRSRLRDDPSYILRCTKNQQKLCIAQGDRISGNPGALRNSSLIFWKLARPNLEPELVRLPTDCRKSICPQHLSWNSGAISQPGSSESPVRPLAQGNRRRPLGTILPHEPVIKTENGDGEVHASHHLGFLAHVASVGSRTDRSHLHSHIHNRECRCAPLPRQAPCASSRSAVEL